jgi:hypothetical protein
LRPSLVCGKNGAAHMSDDEFQLLAPHLGGPFAPYRQSERKSIFALQWMNSS